MSLFETLFDHCDPVQHGIDRFKLRELGHAQKKHLQCDLWHARSADLLLSPKQHLKIDMERLGSCLSRLVLQQFFFVFGQIEPHFTASGNGHEKEVSKMVAQMLAKASAVNSA